MALKMPSTAPEARLQVTYELARERGVFKLLAEQWEAVSFFVWVWVRRG